MTQWYREGTITVANGATAVTGSATVWSTSVYVGDTLFAGGQHCEISAVSSNTAVTLRTAYTGTALTGATYAIIPTSPLRTREGGNSARLSELLARQYNAQPRGDWTTATAYIVQDSVSVSGAVYVCIAAHTSDATTQPTTGASWATVWRLYVNKGQSYGNRSLLINGDFQINQREFAGGALAAGAYGFDRWKAATGGATISRSGFVVTLSAGEIEQVIEPAAFGLDTLASRTVTVSIEGADRGSTATIGSVSVGLGSGTGWQSATVTLGAGDTGNLAFRLKRTSAGQMVFSRVRLELGVGPSDWMPIDGMAELVLARRYFERFPPGTWGSTFHPSTVAAYGGLLFAEKRTAAWTLAHAGTIRIRDRASSASSPLVDTFSLFDKTPRSAFFVANTTGLITTNGGLLQIFSGGYMDIDAEL